MVTVRKLSWTNFGENCHSSVAAALTEREAEREDETTSISLPAATSSSSHLKPGTPFSRWLHLCGAPKCVPSDPGALHPGSSGIESTTKSANTALTLARLMPCNNRSQLQAITASFQNAKKSLAG
ncbi:hypothetical protein CDEST_09709 [Colletotrichum destructivum]|uniref:Uncharacterized protein n=1 Tax=Colletotrichum destructivum TaxID=34406 RepID=A0AAX4IMP0_9PEZI|nr:hypothetical protein CDEST_09709 [Colletotrichum destructivum]